MSDPSHVNIEPGILNSMQQYQDAAYQNRISRLNPQWQQAQNSFDQHNNELSDDTSMQQSQLFKELLAQTMGGKSGTPGGAIA